eukprot:363889-Chlamydomonas_euryale.AAC.9
MDERLAIDMGAAAAAVVASRVTTVHGSADATIPVEDAHAFARVTPQHSLHVVEVRGRVGRGAWGAGRGCARICAFGGLAARVEVWGRVWCGVGWSVNRGRSNVIPLVRRWMRIVVVRGM